MPRTKEQFAEMREKTKNTIRDTAMRLFAENGYHGTSINQIATEAGISKGLIYNYFEKKEDIVEEIITKAFSDFEFMFQEMINLNEPYKAVEIIMNSSFDMIENQAEFYKLLIMVSLQKDLQSITIKVMSEFYDKMYGVIEPLFEALGVEDPYTEARVFGAAFDGAFINYCFFGEKFPLNNLREHFLSRYKPKKKLIS